MTLSHKKGIQQIVSALAALGLKEVVICPGSRNAPLVISFNRHPAFQCTSIRDERSAAFFALGKAQALQQPVAIVCTSGSAALNFSPAIAEAYYQRIPLLVLTADRPKEWTDQGDGQTINQTEVYRNFIRGSYELNGDADEPTGLWMNERCISEGFNKAAYTNPGPVHFNIPVSEPLYETEEATAVAPKVFKAATIKQQLPEETLTRMAAQYSDAGKVMILVGQQPPNPALQKILSKLAASGQVAVLTESTSNIHDDRFIEQIDRCITGMDTAEAFMPDLLITIGGAIVSKRIKHLLRRHRPKYHWNVHPFDAYSDTYQSLTCAIAMPALDFFTQLEERISPTPSDYGGQWQRLKEQKEQRHQAFCQSCTYSDFEVFRAIYERMPEQIHLHLSNSTPIRYAQLFDNARVAETYCNRGTSGIDGCTATAMGAAAAAPDKDFLLITGDVAFHYDSNALWQEADIRNLNIMIINNGGGGIFRIIDGPANIAERPQFLETEMNLTAEKTAAQHNWHYQSVKKKEQLNNALKAFFSSNTKRTILEIFTDAATNPEVLQSYWQYLKGAQS